MVNGVDRLVKMCRNRNIITFMRMPKSLNFGQAVTNSKMREIIIELSQIRLLRPQSSLTLP